MLYYKINYYHNRFFIIDDKYYIYIYISNNNHIYHFELIKKNLFLFIKNKNNKPENFTIKIMYNEKSITLNIDKCYNNYINLGNIYTFKYQKSNDINEHFLSKDFYTLYPSFNQKYYQSNNKFINKENIYNDTFIKYHWHYCGVYNPQMYFKYLLHKYENIILQLNYTRISYDPNKKNTLLFIDDRYDMLFKYILILFIYSVNNTWNITVFTIIENSKYYEKDFLDIGITGKINILEKKFKNMYDYSNIFKNYRFWNSIPEENCLLFQYDSFAMGKFKDLFFDYNYIGARWPHNACMNEKIKIGNGGTSFRKTRIMENICKKYDGKDIKKNYVEDLFFAELLYEEGLLNCTNDIADQFSFENIYQEHSIYAHQIYNTISLKDMDHFIHRKISIL